MNAIEKYELEELENNSVEEKPAFEINSLDSLNWAFRKISALNAQKTEIESLAAAEKQRIAEWEQKETSSIKDSISFFEAAIQKYHFAELAADPKKKTITTPYGKSKSTTSKEQPEKLNEAAVLEHLKANELQQFVQVKETLKWADLKKSVSIVELENGSKQCVDETGQIVPGVGVKPTTITFKVEV